MNSFQRCFGYLSFATAVLLLAGARTAAADSYQLDYVSIGNGNTDQAVYSSGSVAVYGNSCSETGYGPCYRMFDHGSQTSVSATQPALAADDGWACSFSVAGFGESGRCNGNYRAFSLTTFDPLAQLLTPGVYAGALDDPTLVYGASFGGVEGLFLNGKGDVVFEDVLNEEIWQAYDTTPAPEPGTVVLVLGGVAAGWGVRRIAG